jgi:prepilin-type N-terminal cleavage/methylation domain-containing protein
MRKKASSRRGYSLIEMLVSLAILSILLVGLLALMDTSVRVQAVEGGVSDAQQGVRYAATRLTSLVRMTAAGGVAPTMAILPANNVTAGTTLTDNLTSAVTHPVREGTDMLRFRGVISGPLFGLQLGDVTVNGAGNTVVTIHPVNGNCYYNNAAFATLTYAPCETVKPPVGSDSFKQVMAAWAAANASGVTAGEVYVIVSGAQERDRASGFRGMPTYNVGKLTEVKEFCDPANPPVTECAATRGIEASNLPGGGSDLKLRLTLDLNDANARKFNLGTGGPVFPMSILGAVHCGILDDYTVFVHDGAEGAEASPSSDSTRQHPYLGLARLWTNGTTPTYEIQVLAEDVEDFQVAYGIDSGATPDGVISLTESATANADEWQGNVANETFPQVLDGNGAAVTNWWSSNPSNPAYFHVDSFFNTTTGVSLLKLLKLAIVAKPVNADSKYTGPGALGISVMDSTATPVSTTDRYRRRVLDFVVDLRNY